MKWKNIILGIGIGIGASLGIHALLQKNSQTSYITSEKALSIVKEVFAKKGEISASWIHMVPEQIELHGLAYDIYRGGITVNNNSQLQLYEFLVDAITGSIVHVSEVKAKVTA